MIYTIEEFFDVRSPNVGFWKRFHKQLGTLNCSEKTLPFSTRPGVVNESFVPDWNEIIVKKPMDYSVTDGGYGDFTAFVVANYEFSVWTVFVSAKVEVFVERIEIAFEVVLEFIQVVRSFFTLPVFKPTFINIF